MIRRPRFRSNRPVVDCRSMRYLLLILVLVLQTVAAGPQQVDAHRWEGVERIIAIGDVHGDYDHYIKTLRTAGMVNRRGRWSAGTAHLVQTGDIADRGPDTLKIIRHLSGLADQARRAGGRVHHLIGNHEAMNVSGDLRFVTPGEYEAFVTPDSRRVRDRYFDAVIEYLRDEEPERYAGLADDFAEQWQQAHPLGWVEHRLAWDPRWSLDGELLRWVLSSPVAVQLDDLVFVHGGISADYCRHDLASLTRMVHQALQLDPAADPDVLDETGPLWYRGLTGMPPATPSAVVNAILERYEARHIVIGHTPTNGIVWPRHHAGIIMIDVGMAPYYGGHIAWLEVREGKLFAGYPDGMIELPGRDDERPAYLKRVMEMQPDNAHLLERQERLRQRLQSAAPDDEPEDGAAGSRGAICDSAR